MLLFAFHMHNPEGNDERCCGVEQQLCHGTTAGSITARYPQCICVSDSDETEQKWAAFKLVIPELAEASGRPPVPVLQPSNTDKRAVMNEVQEQVGHGGKGMHEDEAAIRSPAPAGPQALTCNDSPLVQSARCALEASSGRSALGHSGEPNKFHPICYGFFAVQNPPPSDSIAQKSPAHEKLVAQGACAQAAGAQAAAPSSREAVFGTTRPALPAGQVKPAGTCADGDTSPFLGRNAKRPLECAADGSSPSAPATGAGDNGVEANSRRCTPSDAGTEPDWGQPVWNDDVVRGSDSVDIGARAFGARYDMKEKLGDGGYATVFRGLHRASGVSVAIKQIDYLKWKICNNGISKQQLVAEFQIHSRLKHPNVVRMMTVFKGAKFIYTVLELVSGGDLFDFLIQKAQHGVAEHVARRWFAQLVEGVDYCHEQEVVHRDLKPENILLTHSSENANLKIADFGLSKALNGQNVCRVSCANTFLSAECAGLNFPLSRVC